MLEQRSDIEQFFLEALEQIKEEIRKKIAIERKQKKFGSVHGGSDGITEEMGQKQSAEQKAFSDKVDINDLDWEDRERVLRLLFSKMNAGVPQNIKKNKQNNI